MGSIVRSVFGKRRFLTFFILLLLVSLVQATVVVNFDELRRSFIEDAYEVLYGKYPFDFTFGITLNNETIPFFENYFGINIDYDIKDNLVANYTKFTVEDIENAFLGYKYELTPFFYALCFIRVFGHEYYVLAIIFDERDFERIFITKGAYTSEKESVDGILYLGKSIALIEGICNISVVGKDLTRTLQVYLVPTREEGMEYWFRAVNIHGPVGVLITTTRALGPLCLEYSGNIESSVTSYLSYYVGISLKEAKSLGFISYDRYIESIRKKIYENTGISLNTPKKTVETLFAETSFSKYMRQLGGFEYIVYALSIISLAFAVILLLESTKDRVYDLLRLGMSPVLLWGYYEGLLIAPIAVVGFVSYLVKDNLFLISLEKFPKIIIVNILLGSIIICLWLHRLYSRGVLERILGDLFYAASIAILVLISSLMGNIYSLTALLAYLSMSTRSFNLRILGKFKYTYLSVAGRSFVKFLVAMTLLIGLVLSAYVAVSTTSIAFADEYSWHKLGCDVLGLGNYDKLDEVMKNLSVEAHVLRFVGITGMFYYDIKDARTGEEIYVPKDEIIAIDPESLRDYVTSKHLPSDLRDILRKISDELNDNTMIITYKLNIPDNTEVLIRATMDFMGMPISSDYIKLKVKRIPIGEYPYEYPKVKGVIITKNVFEKITNIYSMPEGNIRTYENSMVLCILLDDSVSKEVLIKMLKDAELKQYLLRSDIRDSIISDFEKTFLAVGKSSHVVAFFFAFMLAFATLAQFSATGKMRVLQLYRLGIGLKQMLLDVMIGILETFSIALVALIVVITAITLGYQLSITSATFFTVTLNSIVDSLKYSLVALLASLVTLMLCYSLLLRREYNALGRV